AQGRARSSWRPCQGDRGRLGRRPRVDNLSPRRPAHNRRAGGAQAARAGDAAHECRSRRNSMNYYRRYSGDYLRDTARLSLTEHGALTLLLDYYYAEGGRLPLSLEELCLMVRAVRTEERRAVAKVLELYFTRESDGYHNRRADHEIAMAQQARDNGKRGGR